MKRDDRVSSSAAKFFETAPKACVVAFAVFILFTLLINVFVDKSLTNVRSPNLLKTPNSILVFPSLFIAAVVVFLTQIKGKCILFRHKVSNRKFVVILTVYFAAVYLVQLFILDNIWIKTSWDVSFVYQSAENIASTRIALVHPDYFSQYPNNFILTYTEALILKYSSMFLEDPYRGLIAVNALIVCLSVYMAELCIFRCTFSKRVTVISSVMGTVLVAFSPWITIPYSDTIGMIFVSFAAVAFVFFKNRMLKTFAVSFSCAIGYLYKPTIIIPLIALVIIFFCEYLAKFLKKTQKIWEPLCLILTVVTALLISVGMKSVVDYVDQTVLDPNAEFSMTHYLMMGHNPDCDGSYSEEDVQFTAGLPLEERQKVNIAVTISRIKEMGVKGYATHLLRKNINNYNDGTFGWSREAGSRFYLVKNPNNSSAAQFLKSFYYLKDEEGTRSEIFACIEQVIWLSVLMFICFCGVYQKHPAELFISVSLIGVTLFLLIFEARARYLLVFSPMYLVLSGIGIYKVSIAAKNIRKKAMRHK